MYSSITASRIFLSVSGALPPPACRQSHWQPHTVWWMMSPEPHPHPSSPSGYRESRLRESPVSYKYESGGLLQCPEESDCPQEPCREFHPQDMAVAMGTFRHTVASVEHRFLASCFLCFLGSHDTGQQIQGFDVAVKETGVLRG